MTTRIPTLRVYAIPGTEAHLLPVMGRDETVLCGRRSTFLRWRQDPHVLTLPLCPVCKRANHV